jgi:hypothetical protein
MGLFERINDIVVSPKTEWAKIEGEPYDARDLFGRYVAVVAAVPPVSGLTDAALSGRLRQDLGEALALAVVGYALTFVVAYATALIADALAPAFGGRRSRPDALKLVVYAKTPTWLVGAFALYSNLGVLSLLVFYAVYLLWIGAPVMMKTPSGKAPHYVAAVAIAALAIHFALVFLLGAAFGSALIATSLGAAIHSMI